MKSKFERPLPSEREKERIAQVDQTATRLEEAERKNAQLLAAFDWLLKQPNGRVVWSWLFERCGYNKPGLMRLPAAAGGDIAPLSTECAAAQREVYRDMRKLVIDHSVLAAAECEAEFGVKPIQGEKK